MAEILAIGDARDNADLLVNCRDLGYINPDDRVLDMTYGLGRFWAKWRPENLVANDLHPEKGEVHFDWTSPFDPDIGYFDVVVFDPPYKLNGTGGSHASDEAYGVDWSYRSIEDKHDAMRRGLGMGRRMLDQNGRLLVKCMDQVSSGRVQWQTLLMADHAKGLGLRLVDMLHLVGHRKQPPGRRQMHARRNYSTLMVFQ